MSPKKKLDTRSTSQSELNAMERNMNAGMNKRVAQSMPAEKQSKGRK